MYWRLLTVATFRWRSCSRASKACHDGYPRSGRLLHGRA
jgi:hypothetical protein